MSTTPSDTPRADIFLAALSGGTLTHEDLNYVRQMERELFACRKIKDSVVALADKEIAELRSQLASAQAEIGKWKECAQVAIDDLRNVHHGEMNRWPTAAQYKSIALYAALPTEPTNAAPAGEFREGE